MIRTLAWVIVCVCSVTVGGCANSTASSRPASSLEEFVEIPEGRCTPRLEGLYASREAVVDLLVGIEHEKGDAAVSVARAETQQRLAEERERVALASAARAGWLAQWGWVIGAGVGVVLGGALTLVGVTVTR